MSEFKNQLNHFIVNNNLISIAAGVSIGLVTKDAVVSLVGDIIIPIIVILLKTIKNKKIIKFLPVKSELNILPEDFDRFINGTFWNTTTQHPVAMPMTPEEWRILNNQGITGGTGFGYSRIRAGKVLLFPTPTAIEAHIYEYISDHVILSSSGTGQTKWLADTDVPAIDSHILRLDATWRWLKNQGRPYAEEQKIANNAAVERVRANGARRTIKHYYYDKNIKIGYPKTITP